MKSNLSILSAFVGGVVDVVLSMLFNTIFLVAWVMPKLIGQPGPEMAAKLKDAVSGDATVFAVTFVIGSICSILGGYIAAKIAKCGEVLNGALSAWLCVSMGLYSLFAGSASAVHGTTVSILAIPLSIALGAFGGFLKGRRT
jgi:hypothetical protein